MCFYFCVVFLSVCEILVALMGFFLQFYCALKFANHDIRDFLLFWSFGGQTNFL